MEFSRDDTKLVKAIAIIMMIFQHLFAFEHKINPPNSYISIFSIFGENIEFLFGIFGDICISIFTLIGGYGTYKACVNKGKMETVKIIFNKIKKIYVIYWIIFIIFVCLGMLLKVPLVYNNTSYFWSNFFGLTFTYNKEWWFLTPYILLLIIYPIFNLLIKKTPILIDLILVFIINHFTYFIMPNLIDYNLVGPDQPLNNFLTAFNLFSCFMMGCIVAKGDLLSKIKTKFSDNLILKIISIVMFLLLIAIRNKYGATYDFLYALLISIFATLIFSKETKFKKILISIGKESTIIWLTHTIFCYYYFQKIVYFPKISIIIVIWLLAMCYFTSITIKAVIKKIRTLISI